MKISAIEINNFKRIKHIKLEPGADKAVLLIGGKNAQGKSSILDALTTAFGGSRAAPTDPIRHGAEEASIFVRLDDGIEIERIFGADGKAFVEVRSKEGARFPSPQAMLDKLVGGRFLDPLAFLSLDAKKQRLKVLDLADTDRRIPALDEKRKSAFEQRTNHNRDIHTLATRVRDAEIEASVTDPGEPIVVGDLTQQLLDHNMAEIAASQARANYHSVENALQTIAGVIDRLQRELEEARSKQAQLNEQLVIAGQAVTDAKVRVLPPPQVDEINVQLMRADAHNARVAAYRDAKRRAEAESIKLKTATEAAEDCTKRIAEIDKRKADILAASQLPAGLTVGEDGLLLNGVPFDQASGAEQFGAALQLAMAANPKLQDVWIRDGALLDDEHLGDLPALATAAGVRFWVERVGSADVGAIIISDGTVQGGVA